MNDRVILTVFLMCPVDIPSYVLAHTYITRKARLWNAVLISADGLCIGGRRSNGTVFGERGLQLIDAQIVQKASKADIGTARA